MPTRKLRICSKGHRFYKSSNCPICPICEKKKTPGSGFLSIISSPARRALERQDINTLLKLSKYSEKEILGLHGMGPGSMRPLRKALKEQGLSFRKK
jgi:hypothetical protein